MRGAFVALLALLHPIAAALRAVSGSQLDHSNFVESDNLITLATHLGNVSLRFRSDAAPHTVHGILSLFQRGAYNPGSFYDAAPGRFVQGGLGPATSFVQGGLGLPPQLPLETALSNRRGTVALARWEDPSSGRSEFFINLQDATHLDPHGKTGFLKGFTVFAEVVQGLDVADALSRLPQSTGHLTKPVSFRMQANHGSISVDQTAKTPVAKAKTSATLISRHKSWGPYYAPPPLWYNHLAKTGGTFLRVALEDVVVGNIGVIDEVHGLRDVSRPPFTIGSIRNPCDYYVSLWAANSFGRGPLSSLDSHLKKNLGHDFQQKFGTERDIAAFRRWVHALLGQKAGLLTVRLWVKYLADSPERYNGCVARATCLGPTALTSETKVLDELQRANVTSLADCWVKTGNLVQDTEHCLKMYEQPGPERHPGKIRWAKWHEDTTQQQVFHNPSLHAPCEAYYDNFTESLVRDRDRLIFEKFDFAQCCDRSPNVRSKAHK